MKQTVHNKLLTRRKENNSWSVNLKKINKVTICTSQIQIFDHNEAKQVKLKYWVFALTPAVKTQKQEKNANTLKQSKILD